MEKSKFQSIYDEDDGKKSSRRKSDKESSTEDSTFQEIDYGISIKDSIIYLHGDIVMGNLFDLIAKTRLILDKRPKEKEKDPITILINSPGGDVYEALGIIDYIESLPVKVNIIARGHAMSAAALILCCTTGLRAASKFTTIMVHEASAEITGKAGDIKANADHIEGLEESFYTIMASKTKQSEDFWRKACRKDFYMSAARALELGIIDKII